jgi:hypothetical protein
MNRRYGSADSELLRPLRDAGYHVEPCAYGGNNTMVVSFPIFVGEGVRTTADVSMFEQFSIAAFMQRHWADNQVSATITFDPATEGKDIVHALEVFQFSLKGISLLPRMPLGAYKQLPYEAITVEQYNDLMLAVEPIDFSTSSRPDGMDNDEMPDTLKFCDGDSCTFAK